MKAAFRAKRRDKLKQHSMKHFNFLLAICICTSMAGCSMNELGKSSKTVEKLADGFYSMTVTGDAGFDLFLS